MHNFETISLYLVENLRKIASLFNNAGQQCDNNILKKILYFCSLPILRPPEPQAHKYTICKAHRYHQTVGTTTEFPRLLPLDWISGSGRILWMNQPEEHTSSALMGNLMLIRDCCFTQIYICRHF